MKYIKKEDTKYIENNGDVLACKYYHSCFYPDGVNAFGDCGAEEVNNKNWDVFHIQYETKDAYYGIPMLGMGLVDCMILKTDTRPFLDKELNYKVGMSGIGYDIKIEPVVNKL